MELDGSGNHLRTTAVQMRDIKRIKFISLTNEPSFIFAAAVTLHDQIWSVADPPVAMVQSKEM